MEIKMLIGLFIAIAAGFAFLMFLRSGVESVNTPIQKLIPDQTCPKNPNIEDYVERMRTFSPKDTLLSEPLYAISIFKEYLACRNPKTGEPEFTTAEIQKNEPEILACTNVAYKSHIDYLKQKQEELKKEEQTVANKEDIDYYKKQQKIYEAEYKMFGAIFPESSYAGAVCQKP